MAGLYRLAIIVEDTVQRIPVFGIRCERALKPRAAAIGLDRPQVDERPSYGYRHTRLAEGKPSIKCQTSAVDHADQTNLP